LEAPPTATWPEGAWPGDHDHLTGATRKCNGT
jgi:hypothetical protein